MEREKTQVSVHICHKLAVNGYCVKKVILPFAPGFRTIKVGEFSPSLSRRNYLTLRGKGKT